MRRIRPYLCLIGLLVSFQGQASGQALSSARVVKTEGYVSFDKVHPGSSFRLAVATAIDEEWHVNAHVPSFDYLIATTLAIEEGEATAGLAFDEPVYPSPVERAFAFTQGETLRVYEGTVYIGVQGRVSEGLPPGQRVVKGTLTVQACNDKSCLAPATVPVEIPLTIAAPDEPINAINPDVFGKIDFAAALTQAPGEAAAGGGKEENEVGRWVEERGWAVALGLIFLGGLALNLTPCVYPLIPITLAYFGGQASGKSQSFTLASIYVLGMCVTYSALGVFAATTGSILGSALQSPIALVFVALVLVALALSMFGLYDIQIPAFLRNRITSRPGLGGALFMGLTVGLVAAPCVGPFVVSLLAYVGQTGSPVLGFWLFFVLALGLGAPYLLLGGFAGKATGLPRAGAWMDWVKKVFGCIMLAMAIYFVDPLLPEAVGRLAIPVWLVLSGLYLGFIEGSPIRSGGFRAARFATAAACIAIAAFLMIPSEASAGVSWQPFSAQALREALEAGRPVIVDFTAEWCLPCKELDHFTFSDPEVVSAFGGFAALKADVTSSTSPEVGALQAEYGILGAPTIVFIDSTGRERRDLRLTGFENPQQFLKRMKKVE